MKKTLLLLLIVFVFCGCDIVTEIQSSRLIGEWECEDNGLIDTFTFYSDGTVVWEFGESFGYLSDIHTGTWSTNKGILSMEFYGLSLFDIPYTIDNNKLTITLYGYNFDYYKK